MHRTRALIALVALATASGCATAPALTDFADQGDLPVTVTARAEPLSPVSSVVVVTAELANRSQENLSLVTECTPIFVDARQNGQWVRISDLRLCAPPNRTTLPARVTLTVEDQRGLQAGEHRVVIEAADGRQAFSEPFTIPAVR
jgi:hypothetical protein